MIFLPNKFDRFSAGIRNRIQRRVESGDLRPLQRRILRKLHFMGSVKVYEEEAPLSIGEYCKELLGAVQILKIEKEASFEFAVDSEETFIIKNRAFEALILSLCRISSGIRISSDPSGIIIRSRLSDQNAIAPILSCLNSFCLREKRGGRAVVFIGAELTQKKGVAFKTEEEYLKDPFSPVNIYIKE